MLSVAWPETISREIARNAFNKARLRLPASAILDDAYPDLPNEAPPFVPRQQNWHTCRYCGQEFPGRAYRDHHVETRGTCQLEQPLQLRSYLEVLQSAAEAEEDPCALDDDTHSDGDEDGESDSHEYARAIISSAFISWTEGETDKFFYALRRFSRFRPDAIAEHIRTKNESEVIALLELLEEESARLDLGAADVRAQAAPAARKMSQAWIDMEERLAEDAVVWEAFVSQAIRTPPAMRDMVQKAITAERTPFSCLRCSLQTSPICDGRQPTCATCQRKGVHCSWRAGSLERRNVSDPE